MIGLTLLMFVLILMTLCMLGVIFYVMFAMVDDEFELGLHSRFKKWLQSKLRKD